MMKIKSLIAAGFFAAAVLASAAHAQVMQLGPGEVISNSTAAQARGTHNSLSATFNRGFCSTPNAMLVNVAGTWGCVSQLALTQLPTLGADTVMGSIAGGTPIALSQLQLTTLCNPFTTSLSGCVTAPGSVTGKFLGDDGNFHAASGSGTLTSWTPGAGLVSSTTAACSQTAITITGTASKAECVNPQTGTSYAIADGDRAKLITANNIAAQAYSIAQAGAASAFQAGWYTDVSNIGANANSIVTITPTTSTINGASTYALKPGSSVRIVSDGTNYQVVLPTYGVATKLDQQNGTTAGTVVTPSQQQSHDSANKAAATCTVSGTTVSCSNWNYNISSVTRSSAGLFLINFSTAFSASTAYGCVGNAVGGSGTVFVVNFGIASLTASQISATVTQATAFSATDPASFSFVCEGRQ